jgi:exopolysaccharide biosynthesis predicted pyruvyltransferase EpsI
MNIGIVYSEQDKMQKALDFYTKCINIKIVHYGKDSFHLGDSYFNLA